MWPTATIPDAHFRLLDVRFTTYKEHPVVLDDGIAIEPGAIVGEIHCNNLRMLNLITRKRASVLGAARDDLRCLAKWIAAGDPLAEIKALYGVTLLGRACKRLGFTVCKRDLTIRNRMDTFFMSGLLLLYNVEGLRRLGRGSALNSYTEQIWMSRGELLRRYGA